MDEKKINLKEKQRDAQSLFSFLRLQLSVTMTDGRWPSSVILLQRPSSIVLLRGPLSNLELPYD